MYLGLRVKGYSPNCCCDVALYSTALLTTLAHYDCRYLEHLFEQIAAHVAGRLVLDESSLSHFDVHQTGPADRVGKILHFNDDALA